MGIHEHVCLDGICDLPAPAEGTSYVHRAHTPAADQYPALVAERGGDYIVPLTSTAAFRIYRDQLTALVGELERGKISEGELWQTWDYSVGNLNAYLRAAVQRAVASLRPQTAEAPAGTEPP